MKKLVLALILTVFSVGCAHAHKGTHAHTPTVPAAVKADCAVHADYPRKCINRWKDEHTYRHHHSHGHHHNHHHGHHHNHGKAKVKVGVVLPIG